MMLRAPFEVVGCCWPLPVVEREGRWVSDPEWGAPEMPYRPEPNLVAVGDEVCWMIDWRAFLALGRPGLVNGYDGTFRGFHIVARLRMRGSGLLSYWDDDGCVIRRNGTVVHDDRQAHRLTRHELMVENGDLLEVAHWQQDGEWRWGAFLESRPFDADRILATFLPYLPSVEARLTLPDGPPLKMYTNAGAPARTILSVYSLILNGYAPSETILYGSYQWREESRRLLAAAFPFARTISLDEMKEELAEIDARPIVGWAEKGWHAMKAAVMHLVPPFTYCHMDDDILVLDSVDDALAAFATHDFVYGQDKDFGSAYASLWCGAVPDCLKPLPTGRVNAGFVWSRNHHDPRLLATWMREVDATTLAEGWYWEQGFAAVAFARSSYALPMQRYLVPGVNGLPGGLIGYDYRGNPCGYAAIHFAGPWGKPTDREAVLLAPEILGDPDVVGFSPAI